MKTKNLQCHYETNNEVYIRNKIWHSQNTEGISNIIYKNTEQNYRTHTERPKTSEENTRNKQVDTEQKNRLEYAHNENGGGQTSQVGTNEQTADRLLIK